MITEPRLDLLNPTDLVSRAKRKAVESMFGGFYPAAVHVSSVKTRMERKPFDRWRMRCNRGTTQWTRADMELMGAFVSARNGCVF